MSLDLVAGPLEIAGQRAGARGQQPEQEKSDAVDRHAADIRLFEQNAQIMRVEHGEKDAGSDKDLFL